MMWDFIECRLIVNDFSGKCHYGTDIQSDIRLLDNAEIVPESEDGGDHSC